MHQTCPPEHPITKNFKRGFLLRRVYFLLVALAFTFTGIDAGHSLTSGSPANQQDSSQNPKDQSIPDAPSTAQPPKPAPEPPPAQEPAPQERRQPPAQEPAPESTTPENTGPAQTLNPGNTEQNPAVQNPAVKPPINILTVPAGGATSQEPSAQEELFKIIVTTNQVIVPVTVKDDSGRLVNGLLAKDFAIRENGKKETLNFFTSDPFALSAAVILDLGMKDVDVQRVAHTFPALEGAFSEFDEVSIYSYSNAVSKLSDWAAVGQKFTDTLAGLASARGRNNGPPVTSGPLGPQGPTINNMPVDPGAPVVYTPAQESHVLNDAILRAAMELAKRDKARRKVIFVISDGREYRSDASYGDVLRVLLTNNIMVYGIGVGGSAIPGYNKLEKLHLPRFGYSDILPKYVNATGGEVSNELTRTGIEDSYSRLLGNARNQYTLGYLSHEAPTGSHRDIEVLVSRPSCKRSSIRPCVEVTAKEGYYPAPPPR